MQGKKLLHLKDVADCFGVTPKIVSKWIDDGKLAAIKTPGGHRRIIAKHFHEFINKYYREEGGTKQKLLIVDDDATFRDLLKMFFSRKGYDVTCCAGGAEALERYDATESQVVLTDVQMPEMDGKELLVRLKKNHRQAKVIIMTNHSYNPLDFYLLGALEFFIKTVDGMDIVRKVDTVIREKRVSKRFSVVRPVIVDSSKECRSLNISCDGILLESEEPFRQGDSLNLDIYDRDNVNLLHSSGTVIRTESQDRMYSSALYFNRNIGQDLVENMRSIYSAQV